MSKNKQSLRFGNLKHVPVLLDEVSNTLHVKKTRIYIDATLGAGGHSEAILNLGGEVLALDADSDMIELARARLEKTGGKFRIAQGNFVKIDEIAKSHGFDQVDGILFDLGISSLHYTNGRGFSFEHPNEPLDMRLDINTQAVTAANLLNSLRPDQLETMFLDAMEFGEAKRAKKLVVQYRDRKQFDVVGDLLEALEGMPKVSKLHPATKVFAALRMAVNSELGNLRESLPKALDLLKIGGRLVVISFHSGEDRVVKQFMDNKQKPVVPSEEEIKRNPRARSAKMRVLRKTQPKADAIRRARKT